MGGGGGIGAVTVNDNVLHPLVQCDVKVSFNPKTNPIPTRNLNLVETLNPILS